MARTRLIECVPNFSEGCRTDVIRRIAGAIEGSPGVVLRDHSADRDHNRSVFTFTGEPDRVVHAALRAASEAVQTIDLGEHRGVHPRIGAIDVMPFVPLAGIEMPECVAVSHRFAAALWEEFGVPAFFYEFASKPAGKPLEQVRREAAAGAAPDAGTGRHRTAGACAVGARDFLIAWNIWLESADLRLAKEIARSIRGSSGGLPGVKALGLPLASSGLVQVSINSTNFRATPLHVVFERVQAMADAAGVKIRGSELIGLIPEAAVELSAGHDLQWLNVTRDRVL